jgi:glutathione S-transferase
MSWFAAPKATPQTYRAPAGIPDPDARRTLLLYQFDSCPYCARVRREISRLGLDIPVAHTDRDPAARQQLVRMNGRTQVPCLVIDGTPLLESADIIDWLAAYAERGARSGA